METKICSDCKLPKNIDDFEIADYKTKDKNGNYYRRNKCSTCRGKKKKFQKIEANLDLDQLEDSLEKKFCPICRKDQLVVDFSREGKLSKDGTVRREWYCKFCRKDIADGKISKELVSKILRSLTIQKHLDEQKEQEKKTKETNKMMLVSALIELSRYDLQRLKEITEDEFLEKTKAHEALDDYSFNEIKTIVKQKLLDMGMQHPTATKLKAGRYLVVGDSHGKHTKKPMFKLLRSLNKRLKFDKIIHIGHILDDDNIISYCWKDFDNLIVVSKVEEAHSIENHLKNGYDFDVVRDCLFLGKLKVSNQDLISDYVKQFIGTIDQRLYGTSAIINSHRHELDTRNFYKRVEMLASPGCLCEGHIVKTIKQIDFTEGYQVKEAKADSFHKYRRMKHFFCFWEQGLMIVDVDTQGNFSILPCRIRKIEGECATSVYDKIYVGEQVLDPDKKVFINCDMHCDLQDNKVLEIQNEFVKDYKPNTYVNLGDMQNNKALNHHDMSHNRVINKDFEVENASVSFLLAQMAKWTEERYFFYGNHERFLKDFYSQYPQLQKYLEQVLFYALEKNNYKLIKHKEALDLLGVKYVHGDLKLYGQSGTLIEKIAKVYGENTVVGHLHHNSIRSGVYIIGLTGKINQEYNESDISKWIHGFATVNHYKNLSWVTPYTIMSYRLLLGKKRYESKLNNFWKMPNYKMVVDYNFDKI